MTALATRRRAPRARAAGGRERAGDDRARPVTERERRAGDRPRPDADGGRPGERGRSPEPTLFDDAQLAGAGGDPTLDELITGLWAGVVADAHVACPLCGGEMAPAYGAHAQAAVGRCGECGTTLS